MTLNPKPGWEQGAKKNGAATAAVKAEGKLFKTFRLSVFMLLV